MSALEQLMDDVKNVPYMIKREMDLLTKLSYKTQFEQRLLEKTFNDTISSLDKEINLDNEAGTIYLTKTVKDIRKRQSNVFNLHCEKIAVVDKIQNIAKNVLLRIECCGIQLKNEFNEIPLDTYLSGVTAILEKSIALSHQSLSYFDRQLIDQFSAKYNDSASEPSEGSHDSPQRLSDPAERDPAEFSLDSIIGQAKSLSAIIANRSSKEGAGPSSGGKTGRGGGGETKESEAEVFCFCKQPSFGEMIECESPGCEIKWFHCDCVGAESYPADKKWFCAVCSVEGGKKEGGEL